MTQTVKKTRATKKIKSLDFSGDNSGIALVGPAVGGGANGKTTLIYKSLSEENVKKASEITVTLTLDEYLERFFGMWDSVQRDILIRSLGFVSEGMDKAALEAKEEQVEMQEKPEYPSWDSKPGDKEYDEYVNSKIQSIQVMKSLREAKNFEEALANVSEEDYIQLLQDQQVIEKALLQIESEAEVIADDTPNSNGDKKGVKKNTSVVKQKLGEDMTTKDQVEMIEKSAFVVLQKSLDDTKVELNKAQEELKKALEDIAKFQEEKKEAILKSRKELVLKAVGVAEQAEAIFAGLKDAEDAVFNAAVETLANITKAVEQSDLFKEVGKNVEGERTEEDHLQKLIKSKYKNQ